MQFYLKHDQYRIYKNKNFILHVPTPPAPTKTNLNSGTAIIILQNKEHA
jgi:hypothetical protein